MANTRATCECLSAINEVCIENDERRNEFDELILTRLSLVVMQTHLVDAAVQISPNVVRTLVKKTECGRNLPTRSVLRSFRGSRR